MQLYYEIESTLNHKIIQDQIIRKNICVHACMCFTERGCWEALTHQAGPQLLQFTKGWWCFSYMKTTIITINRVRNLCKWLRVDCVIWQKRGQMSAFMFTQIMLIWKHWSQLLLMLIPVMIILYWTFHIYL